MCVHINETSEAGESFDFIYNYVHSCREGMLDFFGIDEKLDKAGIQMKTEDSLQPVEVSPMSYSLIYTVVCSFIRKKLSTK